MSSILQYAPYFSFHWKISNYYICSLLSCIHYSNFYSPTLEQMCYQILSQLNKWNILTGLKTTLVVTTFGKMASQGWLMLKSTTFAIVTRHHQKTSFFSLIYPYFNLLKTMCLLFLVVLNRLRVTYGSNFLFDYEVKIWHLIN